MSRNSQANYSGSVYKRLHLEGFLIPASIHDKKPNRFQYLIFVKGKKVGTAGLDYDEPSTRPVSLQGFIFSLGEAESEKRRREEPLAGSITFQGLVLVRHNETSFKRIGTFTIYGGVNSDDKKDSRWIFKDAQRERITLV